MATVRKEIHLDIPPQRAWDALRDWGAPHTRLVPGFVTQTELDGDDRIVTFFNGLVARERLVTLDERRRRLVWSIVEGAYAHHNGSAEVLDDGNGGTRFVWTSDVLPGDPAMTEHLDVMMERGIGVIGETLSA